jgi:hypothetical protein
MSVWWVFVPVGAITFVPVINTGLLISGAQLVELVGATLYVGLGAAIPGGMLVYAVGIRSRTGPWEGSLKNHLPTRVDRMSVQWVVAWLGIVTLTAAALSVYIVNLGFAWFILLLGGLALSMSAGTRYQDATESVILGLVTGAGLVLVTSTGFSSATTADAPLLLAWIFLATIIAGLPIGALGYLAGRALTEDKNEILDSGKIDGVIS